MPSAKNVNLGNFWNILSSFLQRSRLTVYLTRLNIHYTVLYYSEPQWKDTLLPSFLTCSSGATTMTFSGASLPVE